MTSAVAYYRTSSQTNVGDDKDSLKRQQDAVRAYAASHGILIVGEYYDAAIKGGDAITDRPGFSEMLDYIAGNGARMILVENAGRFARDIVVQITGYEYLKKAGIAIIPTDAPQYFTEDTPSAEMIRGIFAVIGQFEKKSLVEKMKKARDRKRRENGRCEGRKPALPEARQLAKKWWEEGATLRDIARRLMVAGYTVRVRDKTTGLLVNSGREYKPQSVKVMLRNE